jgi:hypothetical protein
MRDGYSMFDTHCHLGEALHSGRVQRADTMLARMDRYGMDRALVIPFPMVRSYREIAALLTRPSIAGPCRIVNDARSHVFRGCRTKQHQNALRVMLAMPHSA